MAMALARVACPPRVPCIGAQKMPQHRLLCSPRIGRLLPVRSSKDSLEQRLDRMEVDMIRLAVGQPLASTGELAGAAPTVATPADPPSADAADTLEQRVLRLEQELRKLQNERQGLEHMDSSAPIAASADVTRKGSRKPKTETAVEPRRGTWMDFINIALLYFIPAVVGFLTSTFAVATIVRWDWTPHLDLFLIAVGTCAALSILALASLARALESLKKLMVGWNDLRSRKHVAAAV